LMLAKFTVFSRAFPGGIWRETAALRGIRITEMPVGGPGSQFRRTILGAYNFARKIDSRKASQISKTEAIYGCVAEPTIALPDVVPLIHDGAEWLIFDGETFWARGDLESGKRGV
jgi:hypothetical protein